MERTTIYLEEPLKRVLLELSLKESKKAGKRIGMAEIIREAIIGYLERKEKLYHEKDVLKERMLRAGGSLGIKFAKRVRRLQREFKNTWKIES